MRKFVLRATFAALFTVVAAIGYAQTGVMSPTFRSGIEPGQLRASKLLGSPVRNAHNIKIGVVKELVIGKDGKVAVIVDVAFVGLGDKYIAFNLGDITAVDNSLTLDRSSDQLQLMARYTLEDENDSAKGSSAGLSRPALTGASH